MKNTQSLTGTRVKGATALLLALVSVGVASQVWAAQFKLGAEEKEFITNPPPLDNHYPGGQMVQGTATYDNPPPQRIQGGTSHQAPLQGNASIALPPAFLGSWLVQGQRTGIDAIPQYQNGVGNLFQGNTQNTWNIAGSAQQGYQMSNDLGVNTPLTIYKVSKNTAFIRYQHPVSKNTAPGQVVNAQEAIVMELQNGGATFQALERISIVKDGEQGPRAKVTYQLNGRRQR